MITVHFIVVAPCLCEMLRQTSIRACNNYEHCFLQSTRHLGPAA